MRLVLKLETSTEEVSFLMKLPGDFFGTFMPELQERNMKIQLIGFIDELQNLQTSSAKSR